MTILSSVDQLLQKQTGPRDFSFPWSSGQRTHYLRIAQKFLVSQQLGAFIWIHNLCVPAAHGRAVL